MYKKIILFLIILAIPISLIADWKTLGDLDKFEQNKNEITLYCGVAKVKIIILDNDLVHVRFTQNTEFKKYFSWAVIKQDWKIENLKIEDKGDSIKISTSEIKIVISKTPCRIYFYDIHGGFINGNDKKSGIGWDGEKIKCSKIIPKGEVYYGFGEKTGSLVKNGTYMEMWNTDAWQYSPKTDRLYQSIPFFVALNNGKSYGIFFDNTYLSFFDMGKENKDVYTFGAEGGEMNYYFIYGPHPKKVIEKYTELTGRMPLPPLWSLGYQQSRYSYYPESKVREIAKNFRERKIPCDVIYLDIHYMDGYRCFTWDKNHFPDPKKMLDDLAKEGFKIVTIIDPGIKNEKGYRVYDEGFSQDHFVKMSDGKYFIGKVWPGECVFPDFTRSQTRDWWGTLYKGLLEDGVRGIWNDMNEPSVFDSKNKTFPLDVQHKSDEGSGEHRQYHNIYGMQMARSTFEGLFKLRPNERPFVLTRAGYSGIQKYATVWTGDNQSKWEYLKLGIPICLNMGLSGVAFVGNDIGGFDGSPTGELFTRWLQFGVFTPFCRTHTAYNTENQEPWSYGEHFENINKYFIELRYKLIPYIYNSFYQSSTSGIPVMRPLILEYPEDSNVTQEETEFLWGNYMLIAPILEKGETKRKVYLPSGEWFNFWTGERLLGARIVNVDAPIDKIPIFIKSGAIIPMQKVMQYNNELPVDEYTFDVYPAIISKTNFYEDDGISFDYKNGKFRMTEIELNNNDMQTIIKFSEPKGIYQPYKRYFILKVNYVLKLPENVEVNNEKFIQTQNLEKVNSGWSYDSIKKIVYVKFFDDNTSKVVKIHKQKIK
jgi:alpha-glucosidase